MVENDEATTCNQLRHFFEKFISLRLWFWTIMLFSIFCIYNTYIYIAYAIKCGVQIQINYQVVEKEVEATTTTYPVLENTTGDVADEQKFIWLDYKEVNNDVILEYDATPTINGSKAIFSSECGRKTCSNVYVNGSLYSPDAKAKAKNSEDPILPLHWDALKPEEIHFSNQTHLRDHSGILSCEEMNLFWSSAEFRQLQLDQNEEEKKKKIIVKKGTLLKFFFPKVYDVVAKEATVHSYGYASLRKEYLKRKEIGWNWKGIPTLLGACVTDYDIRLLTRTYPGRKLCYSADVEEDGTYKPGSCYRLTAFRTYLAQLEDETESAFLFLRSLLCFIGEVEERKLFVENFHGSQITILPDFSIVFEDWMSMFYYGDQNILGGSVCMQDKDCPIAHSRMWKKEGHNKFTYGKCQDAHAVCKDSRCVGFNASMHLCGIARWAIVAMLSHMRRMKDRNNLLQVNSRVASPIASGRSLGKNLCTKMSYLVSIYAKEKEEAGPNGFQNQQALNSGYHQ